KTFMLTVTGDHAWKLSQTIPSDCVTDGKLIYVCENDETHTKTIVNPFDLKKGHNLVLSEKDSDIANGKLVFNCANCDHSERIDAIKFEVKVTPATCTTTGERYVEYTYVDKADNNTEKSDRKTLEILPKTMTHKFGAHSIVVDGTKAYTMSELKTIFGDNLDGYTPIVNAPATCLEEGHGFFDCTDCGETFMLDVEGDCDFTDWTVIDGYERRTCKVCGKVEVGDVFVDVGTEGKITYFAVVDGELRAFDDLNALKKDNGKYPDKYVYNTETEISDLKTQAGNYQFVGWYLDAECSVKFDGTIDENQRGELVLYAAILDLNNYKYWTPNF
ncbi:MAG: hypothetical protein E7381_01885, partial [Clostridiales bacterium]|nr:hypothetical protein [Clostridiales bacterium]